VYRHILIATDGTRHSARAIRAGLGLAKALDARATALYVVAAYAPGAGAFASLRGYDAAVQRDARRALAAFNAAARAQRVSSTAISVTGGEPWRTLVAAARARKCDLIVMASHGRRGVAGLLLGSETTKVLTHSRIPVLVVR
jgi:nucleotide-binding universal stress UspA family protein